MNYSEKQIENAKRNYNNMMQLRTVSSFEPQFIGMSEAEQRCEYHNSIVNSIKAGDKALEKEWKLFFLTEEVKISLKDDAKKAKLNANKAASSDILSPIKEARRIGEFGKWLNNSSNKFRKQHFTKRYTQEAVNAFLSF